MEKPTFVDIISPVSETMIAAAQAEIDTIDWEIIRMRDIRHTNPVFSTSLALQLRIAPSSASLSNTDDHIRYISNIITSVDSDFIINYPKIKEVMTWVSNTVCGLRMGRTMLVKLQGKGNIPLHIDPGPYFEIYKRFHVVFKTHPNIYFIGPPGTHPIHMPRHHLCQLNNIDLHGVLNESDDERIHLIVDIETNNERYHVTGPQTK